MSEHSCLVTGHSWEHTSTLETLLPKLDFLVALQSRRGHPIMSSTQINKTCVVVTHHLAGLNFDQGLFEECVALEEPGGGGENWLGHTAIPIQIHTFTHALDWEVCWHIKPTLCWLMSEEYLSGVTGTWKLPPFSFSVSEEGRSGYIRGERGGALGASSDSNSDTCDISSSRGGGLLKVSTSSVYVITCMTKTSPYMDTALTHLKAKSTTHASRLPKSSYQIQPPLATCSPPPDPGLAICLRWALVGRLLFLCGGGFLNCFSRRGTLYSSPSGLREDLPCLYPPASSCVVCICVNISWSRQQCNILAHSHLIFSSSWVGRTSG